MQSRDNICLTCWLDVSLNAFPKPLFDWSETACRKIPTVLPEVNKDKDRRQHTAIIERQLRGLILSLVILYYIVWIYHFKQYITFENEAQMWLENYVLMHCKRRRPNFYEAPHLLTTPSLSATCHAKLSTNTSSSHTAQ